MATFDGSYWTGNQKIADMPGGISPESNYTPALSVFQGYLYMAYKGAHSNELYLSWFDGESWRGNQKIADMPGDISPESNYGPAIAVYDDALWMIFKGAHSNELYQAEYNGSWSGNQKISDMPGGINPESNYTPALARFLEDLFLIYKGAHSNEIYQATWDGTTWTGNARISDVSAINPQTDRSPAFSPFNDQLYMTYKGASTDNIYEAQYTSE